MKWLFCYRGFTAKNVQQANFSDQFGAVGQNLECAVGDPLASY
jgi:hypothetical protein